MRGLLLTGWLLLLSPVAHAGTLWVAPQGSDEALGTRAAPLASVQAALARDPVARVRVSPGTYTLDTPIVLRAHNSGAVIEAADPARAPVFVGARRVAAFVAAGNGIWRAQAGFRFQQMWVDGRRAIPARSPNEGWFYATGPEGYASGPGSGPPVDLSRLAFRAQASDVSALSSLTPNALAAVRVVAWHSWSVSRHSVSAVQSLDASESRLTLREPSLWPFFKFGPVQRYHLENFAEALDAPGEWFQDDNGVVYYMPRPGEDMSRAVVMAPVVSRFLEADGASNLVLRNLRFQFSGDTLPARGVAGIQAAAEADAAIVIDRARRVRLERIEVAHTGQYAIWIRHDCQDITLEHNLLEDLGAGGVRIGVTDAARAAAAPTSRVLLANSIIRDGGHVYPDGVGVFIAHAGSNRIEHNDISGLSYTGISFGWVWGYAPSAATGNVVAGNRVHHLGFGRLSDLAGIYTLGDSRGSVVRDNLVHDILSYDRNGRGGWGIYADEGTADLLVEGNLVLRTKSGGFHQHYGRNNIVRKNVFAYGRDAQIERSRAEPHSSFDFSNNIVVSSGAPLLAGVWRDGGFRMDNNLFFDDTGRELEWAAMGLAAWRAMGNDRHSIIANPGFVDASAGDFRLTAGSASRGLGWTPPLAAGVRGDASWRARAAAAHYPAMRDPPPAPPPRGLQFNEGFELQPTDTVPALATVSVEGRGDAIVVTSEQAASGRQSLKLRDAQGLAQSFNPYLFYRPYHRAGRTTLRFAVMVEPGAHFIHEWRDDKQPYRTCATLSIQGGALHAAGSNLLAVPSNAWIELELSALLGDRHDGRWRLRVTVANATPREFDLRCRDPGWAALEWLGFISNATVPVSVFLDDLHLENVP